MRAFYLCVRNAHGVCGCRTQLWGQEHANRRTPSTVPISAWLVPHLRSGFATLTHAHAYTHTHIYSQRAACVRLVLFAFYAVEFSRVSPPLSDAQPRTNRRPAQLKNPVPTSTLPRTPPRPPHSPPFADDADTHPHRTFGLCATNAECLCLRHWACLVPLNINVRACYTHTQKTHTHTQTHRADATIPTHTHTHPHHIYRGCV